MKSFSARIGNLRIERPPWRGSKLDFSRRSQSLGCGELKVLYSPRAHKLTERCYGQFLAELVFHSGVSRRGEKLANQRIKQQIADVVSRDQRCLSPWTSNHKLQFGAVVLGI